MNVWLLYLDYGEFEDNDCDVIGVFDQESKALVEENRVNGLLQSYRGISHDKRREWLIQLDDKRLGLMLADYAPNTIDCWVSDAMELE